MKEKRTFCIPEIHKLNIASENMVNKYLKELDLTISQSIVFFFFLKTLKKGGNR